jgi:carboxypeptidase Taq
VGKAFDTFRELLGEVFDLNAAAAVLSWDQQTYMPPGGNGNRAMQLSTLSRLAHQRFVCDEFHQALRAATEELRQADPDGDEARILRRVTRDFDKQRQVPSAWVGEFNRITALAQQAWERAKEQTDFAAFRPHLEKVVGMRREYAEFFAPYEHVYDPLLDDFEPGMKTARVKSVFEDLRPKQVALLRAIAERGKPVDDRLLHRSYDIQKQWDFGIEVIRDFGYDFDRGRQDKSAHPFTTSFGLGDVRITTRFIEDYLPTGMFGTMHEAGHALYEQGISTSLDRTPLATGTSLAIHESQSRMWENLVGRSRAFWSAYYPSLQARFPSEFGKVMLDDFYRAINKVEPSLIRTEADEATYNLHIMLRFELELALLEDRLAVADLPEVWNAKYREYLGITPPNDSQGVLQDIHWSIGILGYFPTYALGNLVACQLWETIQKDLPDLDARIARRDFAPLLDWLRRNIHVHGGKFDPEELLQRVTGSGLQAAPYERYLQRKFGEIYGL